MDPPNANDLTIERVSAVDQVAQRLRTMIAEGQLARGERLREIPLATLFGVSRPIVRDAIRTLTAEGLVLHAMHRGAVVRTLSAADISDIYAARRALELLGLEHWESAPKERRQAVADALRGCEAAARQNDYARFTEHELDLHAALVSLLDNRRLDRFFEQLVGELRLAYGLTSEAHHQKALARRYKRMVAALRGGRPEDAQRILVEHLDGYERQLREVLEDHQAGS